MDNNITGFILSYVLIFVVIIIATSLVKYTPLSKEVTRKVVHIGVSNWWILAMIFFDRAFWPSLGAITFIIINAASYKFHFFRAMESEEKNGNAGTVYFPVSLLVLSIFCFGGYAPAYTGALGILVMGYGDGMAAIGGSLFGKHAYFVAGTKKTIEGSLIMLSVSALVIFIILTLYNPAVRLTAVPILALCATLIEGVTPRGFDNITVPLGVSFLYYAVWL